MERWIPLLVVIGSAAFLAGRSWKAELNRRRDAEELRRAVLRHIPERP